MLKAQVKELYVVTVVYVTAVWLLLTLLIFGLF